MSKTTKTVLTIVWVAIAAVLVGIMLWGMLAPNAMMNSCTGGAWSWRWNFGFGSSVLGDDAQRSQKIEMDSGEPKAIELRFIDETVIVEPTDGDTIRIEQGSAESIPEDEIMRYGMREDTLVAESGLAGRSNMRLRAEVTVTLYLPKDLGYPVYIDTDTGRVEINGGKFAELSVDTGTGAVTGRGIMALETVVDTGTGSVVIDGITSDVLKVYTTTGLVELTEAEARELRIDTTTGTAHAQGSAQFVNIDTTTGEIVTDLANLVDYNIDTTTGRVELSCRDMAGLKKIDVETTTGAVWIRLPENQPGFELDFDTATGSLTNEFGTSRGNGAPEIKVDTATGSLEITKL